MTIISFYLFFLQISGIDHSNVMFHLGGGGTFYSCCIFISLSLSVLKLSKLFDRLKVTVKVQSEKLCQFQPTLGCHMVTKVPVFGNFLTQLIRLMQFVFGSLGVQKGLNLQHCKDKICCLLKKHYNERSKLKIQTKETLF